MAQEVAASKAVRLLKRNHPIVYASGEQSSRPPEITPLRVLEPTEKELATTNIPGLTLFMKHENESTDEAWGHNLRILLARCPTFDVGKLVYDHKGLQYDAGKKNRTRLHHFVLWYDGYLLGRGNGLKPPDGKKAAEENALARLFKTQPIVYGDLNDEQKAADEENTPAPFVVKNEWVDKKHTQLIEQVRYDHQFDDDKLIEKYIDARSKP